MSERRERYAAAIRQHTDAEHGYDAAYAVIALADEEIREWREEYTALRERYDALQGEAAEVARLRAELARANQRLALAAELRQGRLAATVDEEVYNELLNRAHELEAQRDQLQYRLKGLEK